MSKHPITDDVINDYIGTHAKNATLRHTGFSNIERSVLSEAQEYKNGRPRCTRNMKFDPYKRLEAINAFRAVQ